MSDKVESVQELLARWNPAPEDHAMERLVGAPPEEGDTRATTHTPMDEINKSFTSSSVDASRRDLYEDDGDDDLPEVPTDEDGNPQYDDMRNADLKAHLEARGLPVSGNHAELVERLEADDADDGEDDDDEE